MAEDFSHEIEGFLQDMDSMAELPDFFHIHDLHDNVEEWSEEKAKAWLDKIIKECIKHRRQDLALEFSRIGMRVCRQSSYFVAQTAERLVAFSEFREAIACLKTGIERRPKDSALYDQLADTFALINNFARAIEARMQALKLEQAAGRGSATAVTDDKIKNFQRLHEQQLNRHRFGVNLTLARLSK